METSQIKIPFFTKLFLVLAKFTIVLVMFFSIVLLFFLGSGVMKRSNSVWTLVTTEGNLK